MKYILYVNLFLVKLIQYRFLINIILSLTIMLYNSYSNDPFTFFIHDADNNNHYTEENFEDNGQYLPYRPNTLETSQGLRPELEGDNNPNYVETSQGYRVEADGKNIATPKSNAPRIDNPSHYPRQNSNSTLLGTIHSDDDALYEVGIIEPTQSELNNDNIYWGNQANKSEVYIPGLCERLKSKYNKLDKKYEKSLMKYLEEDKKHKIVSEVNRLQRRGIHPKNSVLAKLPGKQKKTLLY